MLNEQQWSKVSTRLTVIQIVALAMIMGSVFFAGLIASMADWSFIGEPIKMLNVIGAGTALLIYGISFAAPMIFPSIPKEIPKLGGDEPSDQLKDKAVAGILALISIETVIKYALIQGGIFLNAMVFMLEPRWVTLIIVALGGLLMLLRFPLKFRLRGNIDQRIEEWQRS
ncbi:MAG: hypothetical protein AAFN77_09825 [Planctomycetota bacterium]